MTKKYEHSLVNALDDHQHLVFYKIMQYEIPREYRYFLLSKKTKENQEAILRAKKFPPEHQNYSRTKKNPHIDEFLKIIKKYTWLYRTIPHIQSIYLCNSITFNAIQPNSDIDLFIVTKKGALRRARLRSTLMCFFVGIKRGWIRGKEKKFCLSFYVTHTHQNLYSTMLPQNDIYFIYRLAHLVPLYQETPENIYKHNKWIEGVLPNFPGRHCIDIGIDTTTGKSRFKKIIEFIGQGIGGKILEYAIQLIRLPIVIYKAKKMGEKGRGIVINKNMLKFHRDIRKKVHLLYIMYKKKITK